MTLPAPIQTLGNLDDGYAIEIYPFEAKHTNDGGFSLRSPVLRVATCAGEMHYVFNVKTNRFGVIAPELRFGGMPAGVTLNVVSDEARHQGFLATEDAGDSVPAKTDRCPVFSAGCYDKRSDSRPTTQNMRSRYWAHLDIVTKEIWKSGLLGKLVSASKQWSTWRRISELDAEISCLVAEREDLRREAVGHIYISSPS